jgi:hypothetical protein
MRPTRVKSCYIELTDLLDWETDLLVLKRLLSLPLVVGRFKPAILWAFSSADNDDNLDYARKVLDELIGLQNLPISYSQGDMIWEYFDNAITNGTLIWHNDYNDYIRTYLRNCRGNLFQNVETMGKILGYPCPGEMGGDYMYIIRAETWDHEVLEKIIEAHGATCTEESCDWTVDEANRACLFNFACDIKKDASAIRLGQALQKFYDKHDIPAAVQPSYHYYGN